MNALTKITTDVQLLSAMDARIYELEGEWDRLPWESLRKTEISCDLDRLRAERDDLDRALYPEARS